MILYETNIPHVYCVYEGVTINAINTNGNALLEDNTLLDEDYFYTVIDVIDENAHARKLVVKGIKTLEKKAKPIKIKYRDGDEYAKKFVNVISPYEKRLLLRNIKKYNGIKKPTITKAKNIVAKSITNGTTGIVKPSIAPRIMGVSKGMHKAERMAIETHEGRHLLQNQRIIKDYGIQALRNVPNNSRNINFKITNRDMDRYNLDKIYDNFKKRGKTKKDAYNAVISDIRRRKRYRHDPLEYDAFTTEDNIGRINWDKNKPSFKSKIKDEQHPGHIGKKELNKLIRDKDGFDTDMTSLGRNTKETPDASAKRLALSTYAATHPKYLKKFSKDHMHFN